MNKEFIRVSIRTKRKAQNFGFGDLRSSQCCDLTIIRQWENLEMLFIPNVRVGEYHLYKDILILGRF